MHRPLFLITAGSVAAVGALITATALPAGAATSIRAETMAFTSSAATSSGTPTPQPSPFPSLSPCATAPNYGCADTPVTFSVTSNGVLAITAPTALVDLGSGVAGNVGTTIGAPGNFGAVTVIDNRALNPAGWTASVSSTNFVNASTGIPADTIPATAAKYIIPAITAPEGLPLAGSGTSGSLTNSATEAGITLGNDPTGVVTVSNFDGDNGATWSPTIDVAVPGRAVVGTYDAWVTHSVS